MKRTVKLTEREMKKMSSFPEVLPVPRVVFTPLKEH